MKPTNVIQTHICSWSPSLYSACFAFGGCAARSAMMVSLQLRGDKKNSWFGQSRGSCGRARNQIRYGLRRFPASPLPRPLLTHSAGPVLFDSVVSGDNADYILGVTILYYDQPWIGLDLDIKMKTKWELTDAKETYPCMVRYIETTYRAKVSDAFVAAETTPKGQRSAVRTNIAEGIRRLSQIKL